MCWVEHPGRSRQHHRGAATPRGGLPVGDVRVDDADRQAVIDVLRRHTTDGRLTLEEFEERVGEAWSARTGAELAHVLRHLPHLVGRARPSRRPTAWRGPAVPVPVLVVTLVVVASILSGHFLWFLLPVGFFLLGGCRGSARHHRPPAHWSP